MGKNSTIEWTDHTFNPWWGCTKISPGCTNCYAETWAKRVGKKVWGDTSPRRFFSDKHWAEPLNWNEDAKSLKRRRRVFCASMADVFEGRRDLDEERERLWELIENTPNLDWLLLTKRPENIGQRVPWRKEWPPNVWLGTTVEDQERATERLPLLLRYPARTRFLSCEPLIGPLDLSRWLMKSSRLHPIDWVIAGGESGANARPMLPGWALRLRDQCGTASVPFHFKQWGHWAPVQAAEMGNSKAAQRFWDEVLGREVFMEAKGKREAGRHLDGKTWDEVPEGLPA